MNSSRRLGSGAQRAGSRVALAVSLALAPGVTRAQSQPAGPSADRAAVNPPAAAQSRPASRALRLSDWLLQQPQGPDAYPLGLSLRLREEVPSQTGLKVQLVAELRGSERRIRADPAAMERLGQWIAGLPVTGRVPVASADGRWLQTNPAYNPVLSPGYAVVVPPRPRTVTVIANDGALCKVVHIAGREAADYVDACRERTGAPRSDWAWIAQPDGRVQRAGIALWNAQKQDEPAAGAWIWAPGRGGGWPDEFSERLIRFLATQGPAPDWDSSRGPQANDDASVAATHSQPASGSGATAATGQGMVLGGGLSMALSETFLAQHTPAPPPLPASRDAPLLLRDESRTARSRNAQVSSSDWGTVGLLQTPTARMRDAGYLSGTYAGVYPYTHGNIIFQPFDWMEAGFRYTDVRNRPYGPFALSGNQTYKDKSIDAKFRLWSESAYLPQVAVGLRDIGGTGLFAGEYVVANKRTGDFDWSVGLGWGYVGARGDMRNPLSVLGSAFDTRTGATGQGGNFALTRYFRGPTALFGGVQYHTPWEPLTLKAEYDGNDYQHEPQGNNLPQRSPVNVGLVYRAWKGVDLSVALERGNRLMFAVSLNTDLSKLTQPKLSDPRPVPVADTRPAKAPDWSATARELRRQTDWDVRSIEQRDNDVKVVVEDAGAVYWRDRIDRAAAVLHRDAPANVDRFTLSYRGVGMDLAEHVIDREAWVTQKTQPVPPSSRRETVVARPAERDGDGETVHLGERKVFDQGLRLSYAQTIGGPDAFVLWQLGLVESARLRLRDDTWLQGSVRLRLVDNYDKFKYTGPSNLPRVRTFLREYLTTSRVTMPNLQLAHVGRFGENQFYSAYAGYLEEMYGGVGGEWLYRPFASNVAFGVDLNAVRQRNFEQDFGFRDYRTVTGHATLYWDTGWNDVLATLHVGRYLAKDLGATLQLSRVFRNGVTIGAFATRTNVSAAQFGEGSFDKGVFVSIPFDALFTRSSGGFMTSVWKPLTRDGGAMLARAVSLYGITGPRGDRTLWFEPAPLPENARKAVDRPAEYTPPRARVEPYTRVTPKPPAERWEQPRESLDELRLAAAIQAQGFRNVTVRYDPSQRVLIEAANDRLKPIGRAVGRVARTALLHAPLEARGISVTLFHGAAPQARYEFFDLERLKRHLDGESSADALREYVKVEWINPAAAVRDALAGLNDLDPEVRPASLLAALAPDTVSMSRVASDYVGAAKSAAKIDWLSAAAFGTGITLASTLADQRAFRIAEKYGGNGWVRRGITVGNALPVVGIGVAGLLALDGSDPRRSRTGYASLEAGATAYAASIGLKYVLGRARPSTGLGYRTFDRSRTSEVGFQSFPSGHTMIAWALATPFALEYDMPWLYGVAAVTNLARIGGRDHWVSDTVASTLLGYGLGRVFWQSSRDSAKEGPRVLFDGSSLGMLWKW